MGKPGFWGGIVLALMLLGTGPAAAGPEFETAKLLVDGRTKLDALTRVLRSRRAENGVLIDALETALSSHEALRRSMGPFPLGDGELEVYVVPEELEKDIEAFFRKAEKQFLKAFTLERTGMTPVYNEREPVNIKAAEALGATDRKSASVGIVKALEGSIFKRKTTVSAELLSSAFGALAALGHVEGLQWMIREFTHSKASPRREVDRLVAAHAVMVLFEPASVPGRVRHELVKRMVLAYTASERQAVRSGIAAYAEFWSRVGPGAIEATRHFAGRPLDERGVELNTMAELRDWYDDHRNPRREPW